MSFAERDEAVRTTGPSTARGDDMNWLVGLAFVIPVVLINGFLLMMAAAVIGLGGPFNEILACGFLISLIPGFLAMLFKRLIAPPPPAQKAPGQ
jgi:hypothetical protein